MAAKKTSQASMNPENIKKSIASAKEFEAEKKALKLDPEAAKKFADLSKKIASGKKALQGGHVSQDIVDEFSDLAVLIEQMQADYEEIHGCKYEMGEMNNLVTAYNMLLQQIETAITTAETEKDAKIAEYSKAVEEAQEKYDAAVAQHEVDEQSYKDNLAKKHAREEQEYNDNLEWTRKIADRERNDEIARTNADLTRRMDEMAAKEAHVADLEAQVTSFPDKEKVAYEEGYVKGKTDANNSNTYAVKELKAQAESAKTLFETKEANYVAQIEDLKQRVKDAENARDAAIASAKEVSIAYAKTGTNVTVSPTAYQK